MASAGLVKKPVKFFYDVVSPYSWIGFEVLCRYRQKWNIDLILKPFFLGGIMKESGNSPPMMVVNKGIYMMKDLKRLSEFYKIPINIVKDPLGSMVEKGSLAAQRLVTAVQESHPEKVEDTSRELWLRFWSRDEDIYEEESLKAVLLKVGFSERETDKLVAKSKDKSISNKLKQTTQEAIDAKAFGAPTIIVKDSKGREHVLFGSDRMEVLASLIGEHYQGPLAELSKL